MDCATGCYALGDSVDPPSGLAARTGPTPVFTLFHKSLKSNMNLCASGALDRVQGQRSGAILWRPSDLHGRVEVDTQHRRRDA